jgi:hypothetical protein
MRTAGASEVPNRVQWIDNSSMADRDPTLTVDKNGQRLCGHFKMARSRGSRVSLPTWNFFMS